MFKAPKSCDMILILILMGVLYLTDTLLFDQNALIRQLDIVYKKKTGITFSDLDDDVKKSIADVINRGRNLDIPTLEAPGSIRHKYPIDLDSRLELRQGDCMELIQEIPDNSIDFILADLPYGVTDESWDIVIDPSYILGEMKRIITDRGNIILTTSKEFSLLMGYHAVNQRMYKNKYTWVKNRPSNGFNARHVPLDYTEDILHLTKYGKGKSTTYNTVNLKDVPNPKVKIQRLSTAFGGDGTKVRKYTQKKTGYPTSIFTYDKVIKPIAHPTTGRSNSTQKPIDLLVDLIEMFSNDDEIVLDLTMGSGSTAVASLVSNRRFLGFELSEDFYGLAVARVVATLKLQNDGLTKEDILSHKDSI